MCVMLFSDGFRTIAPVPGGLMTARARHGYCSRGRGTPRRKHSKATLRLSILDRPLAQREGGNEEAPLSRPAFRIDGSLL